MGVAKREEQLSAEWARFCRGAREVSAGMRKVGSLVAEAESHGGGVDRAAEGLVESAQAIEGLEHRRKWLAKLVVQVLGGPDGDVSEYVDCEDDAWSLPPVSGIGAVELSLRAGMLDGLLRELESNGLVPVGGESEAGDAAGKEREPGGTCGDGTDVVEPGKQGDGVSGRDVRESGGAGVGGTVQNLLARGPGDFDVVRDEEL